MRWCSKPCPWFWRRDCEVSSRCTHVKGHGGAKATARAVQAHLKRNAFVMRTDFKGYYGSIDQHHMLEMISLRSLLPRYNEVIQ